MRICYMTGAVKNAGDFLIERRTIDLLKYINPNSEIVKYQRNGICYDKKISELNTFDFILFAGGPLFQAGIYPKQIPFVSDLGAIKVPVFFLGGGIYNNQKYVNSDYSFFSNLSNGNPLGCRDLYSYRVLKSKGIKNLMMTGCPAFYDLDYINKTNCIVRSITKICVSDNAYEKNTELLIKLLEFLRNCYAKAKILFVIHRDKKSSIKKLENNHFFEKLNIEIKSIADSDDFSCYDDCSIHVGFRVHAHVYNLSRRNVSVLLNEDMRGYGINTTLGLENIFTKNSLYFPTQRKFLNILPKDFNIQKPNDYTPVFIQLESILEMIEQGDLSSYEYAFSRMMHYWNNMQNYLHTML